ncbi:uncharacterized protein LOC127526859 [Erpetoichthys calabaricus]|uniref:uncharacterized protein LOC127526859 n=1 Tax=Erpetoichthys calabaricus TaxID=27687 RepID=UPI002233E3E0|nr:uncharacterized protein LOC127526859 [Erpetoichthys calabaricus]
MIITSGLSQNSYTLSCVASSMCNSSVSMNYGLGSLVWISECCSSDLCSTHQVNLSSEPNGLVCCAGNDGRCQNMVNCTGMEEFCFASDDGINVYYGCASRSVCENPRISSYVLQFSLTSQTECCQGDLCNMLASPLTCNNCSSDPSGSCNNTATVCSSQWRQCASIQDFYRYSNGYVQNQTKRSCILSSACNVSISVEHVNWAWGWTSQCCDSDLCNDDVNTEPNGLVCCSGNDDTCLTTVTCTGDQHYCFISETEYEKGCTSRAVCEDPINASAYLPETIGAHIKCCQGAFCNKPNSTLLCQNCFSGSWEFCQQQVVSCNRLTSSCGVILESNHYGNNYDSFCRGCSSSDNCNVSLSINYGYGSYSRITKCCSSDLCNTENVTMSSEPNGLSCCKSTDGNCQGSVTCTGIQDHCFTSDMGYMGCISGDACENPAIAFGFLQTLHVNCCQGTFCNKNYAGLACVNCNSSYSFDSCGDLVVSCDPETSACVSYLQAHDASSYTKYRQYCGAPVGCNMTGSLNYGYGSNIWSSVCCTTDICNSYPASLPSKPNGLECCAGTDGTCQSTVICLGIEDHCFISDDGTNVYQGCSSRSVCENPGNFSSFLQMSLSQWTECCQGSFCNRQNLTMTCQSCISTAIDYYCPNATIQCPSQWRVCATSVELYTSYQFDELFYSYNGYYKSPYYSRLCVTPDTCNGSGSVNYGYKSWTKIVECCTSDMCNSEGGVIPSEPNGLVCCFGSSGDCKMFVPCKGTEDHCFTSENGFLGCASSSVCKNPGIANQILEISSPSQISCCQGYLCNKPPSILLCHNCHIYSPGETCENKSNSVVPCDSLSSMCSSGQDGNGEEFLRQCTPTELCNKSVSFDYGIGSIMWTFNCCSSDLCNSQNVDLYIGMVTAITFGEPNGLVCCGADTGICGNLVQCTGIEEFCFTSEVLGVNTRYNQGCASQSVCDTPWRSNVNLPFTHAISCCQGFLCNKPASMLVCNQCSSSSLELCDSTMSLCSFQFNNCVTALSLYSSGSHNSSRFERDCAIINKCNTVASFNCGVVSETWITECCDTDFCNNQSVTYHGYNESNGLVCCADQRCQTTVNCTGLEDSCFIGGKDHAKNTEGLLAQAALPLRCHPKPTASED